MSPLEKYQAKRHFEQTPEPKGKVVGKVTGKLRFVIQKHQASSLHYDFRIEVDGVLKSWAVPKGPSLNPDEKHLAVMVEDHPYEYKDFEGVIPEKNYGAGTVMVWDEGFYQPIGALASKDLPTAFEEGVKNGHIVFLLAGHKLNGEFAFIKLRRGGKNDWLLVKARDQYATERNILDDDKSAKSGKTMEEIADPKDEPIPHNVKPMMATLVAKPFDDPNWSYEIKWDGYRAITEVTQNIKDKTQNSVRIYSRNDKDFNERFPEIAKSFAGYDKDAVFDGEIVAVDEKGRSDFGLLQMYQTTGQGRLVYYVFDLLYYDGADLTGLPLTKRREILKQALPKAANIQFSDDIPEKGIEFFEAAKKQGLEGIMAKRANSLYQTGKRSHDWQKIKLHMQQEAIICGFTAPRGTRNGFGALVLGVYDGGKITYIGNVGTGFDEKLLTILMKKMKPLTTDTALFDLPKAEGPVTWLKPNLVCEVKFQEWTGEHHMRQPVFLGLREDKDPKDVHLEVADGR